MSKNIFDKFTAIFDHFVYLIMAGSAFFVKSAPVRAFSVSF